MRELHHFDIFTLPNNKAEENIVCVTTNGIIKRDGTAVMGAGIAKTANLRFKVAEKLADSLRTNGNVVSDLGIYYWKTSRFHLVAFPTKHDWRNPSDLQLIEQSAKQLVAFVNTNGFQHIFLTRPGCACGQLDWESQVKPILENILDDRFTIVYRQTPIIYHTERNDIMTRCTPPITIEELRITIQDAKEKYKKELGN